MHLLRLQKAFVKQAHKLRLYDGSIINLDFHTIPHFGDESVLKKQWAGSRNKKMKGALTLFAQDASSKMILYTAVDIQRDESDDQILAILYFWKNIRCGIQSTFVFDSKFTAYSRISQFNLQNIKFITLRRRGKKLIDQVKNLGLWSRIHILYVKGKYSNPI